MSVMTMPSSDQTVSCGRVPFDTTLGAWPVSLPPMFTRSSSTPGTERSTENGSREVGIFASSSRENVVDVPVAVASRIGAGAETVTDSVTAATRSSSGASTVLPTATITSRVAGRKPDSAAVSCRCQAEARGSERRRPRLGRESECGIRSPGP